MDILWKGVVGGLVTALIVWASKRGNVLPGILPLAPTFAVIALLAVGAKGNPAGFREACLAGFRTIPAPPISPSSAPAGCSSNGSTIGSPFSAASRSGWRRRWQSS